MKKSLALLLAVCLAVTTWMSAATAIFAYSDSYEVESFTVKDVTFYEDWDSELHTDDKTGEEYHYYDLSHYFHRLSSADDAVTVTFAGSDEASHLVDGSAIYSAVSPALYFSTNAHALQQEEHWTAGNTYTVTAYLWESEWENVVETTTFQVTIEKNPIAGLNMADITLYEGLDSWTSTDWETEEEYQHYSFNLAGTVIFEGGAQVEVDGYVEFNDRTLWINTNGYELQQQEHWTAGNTYTVTATVAGVTDTFQVTIEKNPIVGLDIADVTLYEGLDSGTRTDWETEEEYQHYSFNLAGTVIFEGGAQAEIDGSVEFNGKSLWIDNDADSLQQKEHWTAGNTYTVTATVAGVTDTFQVTIKSSPVVSLDIADITRYEGLDGWMDTNWETGEEYLVYSLNPTFTVTFEDNTQQTTDFPMVEFNGRTLWINTADYYSMQRQEHWMAGNTYTVTATVAGVTGTFQVTIEENPVASLDITDITLYEGLDSFTTTDEETGEEYQYYNECVSRYPDFTVTFRDGTKKSSADSEDGSVEVRPGQWWWLGSNSEELQRQEHWTAGNTYTVTGMVAGVTGTFHVTIKENPVASLDIADVTLHEGLDGWTSTDWETEEEYFQYSVNPRDFTVTFKDGAKQKANNQGYITVDGRAYSAGCDVWETQEETHWTAGKTYEVIGEFAGLTDAFKVTIEESYQSLTISGKNQLILTFTKKNGQKETERVVKFDIYMGGGDEEETHWSLGGYLYTDRRIYEGAFFEFDGNGGFVLYIGDMESNYLVDSAFFDHEDEDGNIVGAAAVDANGDEEVTVDDAVYLLYHLFKPEDYPVGAEQDYDFNGDGTVSADDAIYLLYHIFLPGKYPV